MPALQAQKEDKQEKKQEAINAAHAGQVQAAQKAAEAWLTLVDAEKYDESWKETSPFLQSHVPEKSWEKHMQTMRAMVDRTLHTTQYRDQFPGLPAGEYVAFVWETYFGAKRTMLESLIMSFDGSQWKPVGYAVQ
jgi:ribosomal protein S20